ncbi:hypothetical protein TTHERM_00006300 (macronuclear) [Tetrahymena thermophila SB210]|uniref:Uncharacterized protein n=1 Tax=Tetrahymena thermophila (strain SB210) TaxID=312017 RepID=Q22SA6_TETTS|nr:hypothetical protein TTHERM_00006300 [Tetrahymena thermophila SB210]EAR87866.2 hypothetical protein TTHERM_00006300 [Tetrahymena thermophila SB210]|eukprot:XP_001008111.2 hypothetical protein TTHERM_00006300 [Tetrahymena thermophila SB210]
MLQPKPTITVPIIGSYQVKMNYPISDAKLENSSHSCPFWSQSYPIPISQLKKPQRVHREDILVASIVSIFQQEDIYAGNNVSITFVTNRLDAIIKPKSQYSVLKDFTQSHYDSQDSQDYTQVGFESFSQIDTLSKVIYSYYLIFNFSSLQYNINEITKEIQVNPKVSNKADSSPYFYTIAGQAIKTTHLLIKMHEEFMPNRKAFSFSATYQFKYALDEVEIVQTAKQISILPTKKNQKQFQQKDAYIKNQPKTTNIVQPIKTIELEYKSQSSPIKNERNISAIIEIELAKLKQNSKLSLQSFSKNSFQQSWRVGDSHIAQKLPIFAKQIHTAIGQLVGQSSFQ